MFDNTYPEMPQAKLRGYTLSATRQTQIILLGDAPMIPLAQPGPMTEDERLCSNVTAISSSKTCSQMTRSTPRSPRPNASTPRQRRSSARSARLRKRTRPRPPHRTPGRHTHRCVGSTAINSSCSRAGARAWRQTAQLSAGTRTAPAPTTSPSLPIRCPCCSCAPASA